MRVVQCPLSMMPGAQFLVNYFLSLSPRCPQAQTSDFSFTKRGKGRKIARSPCKLFPRTQDPLRKAFPATLAGCLDLALFGCPGCIAWVWCRLRPPPKEAHSWQTEPLIASHPCLLPAVLISPIPEPMFSFFKSRAP